MEIRHNEWKPVEAKRTVMMWKIQKLKLWENIYLYFNTERLVI